MCKFPDLIEAGLKVGDEIDTLFGTGVITDIDTKLTYPIAVVLDTGTYFFTRHGLYRKDHKLPSLWIKSNLSWFTPPTELPEPDHIKEFYTGRKVWVTDNPVVGWFSGIAAVYLPNANNRFCTFSCGDTEKTADAIVPWGMVSYTRPKGSEDHEQ